MLKRVFILLLLLTLGFELFFLLDTSEQSSLSDKEQKSYSDSDTSINDNITPAIPESTTVTETPPEVIQPEPPIPESKESTSATSDTITPKRAIDLTLPEDWDAGNESLNEVLYDVPQERILPNLLIDKKKPKNMSLDGKVLKDETKEGYIKSIEGAEVSVEIKM
jgi:hypothetical protein